MMTSLRAITALVAAWMVLSFTSQADGRAAGQTLPEEQVYVNSLGMSFVRVAAGTFLMGFEGDSLTEALTEREWQRAGDFDEHPRHRVAISRPFHIGAFEVTNAQYEQFDPAHRSLRGKHGLSQDDDEAVVFVSWHEASRFAAWLSDLEGRPYRLPTEAEWEYAARAGTTARFHTGPSLPELALENNVASRYPPRVDVSLEVGSASPNAWGLHDVHGNVEEWCLDWYGPYEAGDQTDPVGRVDGDFRVTRGGSHSTTPYYLRSANRMGTLPENAHGLIGFRLVIGAMSDTEPLPAPPPPLNQRGVSQDAPLDLDRGPEASVPFFNGPRVYMKIPRDTHGEMFESHNHDPGLAECWNGDLLAIWYSTVSERGRHLVLAASRLRHGEEEWEPASPFWDAPDRNDHAPALWFDGDRTLYHFVGLSTGYGYNGNLAMVLRTSTDCGATWSKARLIGPEHQQRHQAAESVFRATDGSIVLATDANPGSTVLTSRDEGLTWTEMGGTIAGIHAGVVQLTDRRLMAMGRGDNIEGMAPKSVSTDMGRNWSYSATPFQALRGMQRPVLFRTREGPLLFISFSGARTQPNRVDMMITDATGLERPVSGLFAALSFDEGETWPTRRLISDDTPSRQFATTDRMIFTMSRSSAESFGYLAITQTPDGIIHLISSKNHYMFNLAWLRAPPPPEF
jgi:formylglycine-generating enzyme required for sulfatase activity